ncbi:MAG: hypothetical protein WD426_02415 [Anditalea sp.]
MNKEEEKKRLLDFLDIKAFDPIINKSKEDYDSENKKKKFEDVKRSTEKEKERFHNYNTAEDIKENYRRDLSSEPAKKVHAELKYLDLPRLPDLKDEFFQLCDDLNVK